ncbi:putative inhibitor of apoptosis-like protein [Dinothrombium tinctorium]|uniref:Putative inhibitor of apoptosis-like protein n=1 Tax=Dinothrombium tinctorium TaxID=1965070 RepID=A0A3S3PZ52_9ACAR|nr:putative inhibitor of apoptosis-like protein [Dinothrombium tinctorium]
MSKENGAQINDGNGNNGNTREPRVFEPVMINRRSTTSSTEVNGNSDSNIRLDEFFTKMRDENERLKSFRAGKWPLTHLDPKELAKAGFFYLLNSDRVQCAFCRGVVCDWEPGDIPLMEHMRHFPRCPFLLEYDVGNIPIGEDPIRSTRNNRALGRDVCGNTHHHNHTNHNNSTSPLFEQPKNKVYSLPVAVNLKELGVRPHQGAKNVTYITYEARLSSFSKWPQNSQVKSESLAEAGFFYIGVGDYVKCYYCDGGLCHWETDDDPWVEHARWFPDCGFVLLNKGYPFVESVKQKYGDGIARCTSADEDALAIKVVDQWMKSDTVKQLLSIHKYSDDVIKAALHKRWIETQSPFEHLGELNAAVVECLNLRNVVLNRPEDQKSGASSELCSSPETSSPLESYESNPSCSQSSNNSDKEERLRCKICLDREVGVLFLPCGHVVACTQCAPGVVDCPICRKAIKGIVRTFFS